LARHRSSFVTVAAYAFAMMPYLLEHLTNPELLAQAERLVASERRCAAELVVHVAEIERRRLHLARGFHCLHAYCTEALGLSDYEAFNRIEAARAGRQFPRVFEMLLDGSLSLTTVQLLARRLTAENHVSLLAEAAGKTKKEVLHLLARRFPQPDARESTRKLPAPPPAPQVPAPQVSASKLPAMATASPTVASVQRTIVAPLAPDRYKVVFTADTETTELLELAKDMLSHAVPSRETAEVVKRALKALVVDLARTKFGATTRPRASDGPKNAGDVAAAVKRAVWVRDRGSCAFVGTTGRRCGSRRHLEFHHLRERGEGGKGTIENIQLRCGPHNRYEAEFENGVPKRAPMAGAATRSGTSAYLTG
jgi:hypothetical protein